MSALANAEREQAASASPEQRVPETVSPSAPARAPDARVPAPEPVLSVDDHRDANPASGQVSTNTGWTQDHVEQLADEFAQTSDASVEAIDAAADWWGEVFVRGNLPSEGVEREHGYNLSSFGFSDEDMPLVTHFANAMAANGASQEDVFALIRHYLDNVAPQFAESRSSQALDVKEGIRELEAADREHKIQGAEELREAWGKFYVPNLREINRYLDSLPAAQRERIENERLADGRLALNDPKSLQRLLRVARGSGAQAHSSHTPAPRAGNAGSMTRAQIEEVMRTDRTRYTRSEEMQARYLEILNNGERGTSRPLPSHSRSVSAEIAELEETMRSDRRAWNKNPALQARYLELLSRRDG